MKANPSFTSLFFLVIFTSLFVTGCGQSGVLYLPEQQQQDNQTPASKQPKQDQQKQQQEEK
ncbi:LPS translocon maturation chaperone LptM [Pseudoalteromonas phenolica]|uniref:Lipoprotein n=1 Tax=Pseudoalteromonas phenolica TaxID=161398 RepID=A0A0S2JWT0_9GAMM|nr:lipoprotein [Pseudoalteromonas phenolica]ALO40583.1 hypothetical protein PP2015_54 [Pseudoalteromonas phenolica]MBE0354907.1 hypothetical protein [Pseudoalteromonas phenolica O-BC30]RXE95670.1 hypothetical protein D9981_14630 [Pseudoalteromonas phenolica O-BC30]TMO53527.1 hypothetical protein CWC21_19220 [Pseudoalteromonas phenolica]